MSEFDSDNTKTDFNNNIKRNLFANVQTLNDFVSLGNNNNKILNKRLFDDEQNKKQGIFSKLSPAQKPDFSTIEKKESNFKYKERGSYKKPKCMVPESPMKSPNQKFFTPVKLQSDLFGNTSAYRKLNFTEINESPKEQENNLTKENSFNNNNNFNNNKLLELEKIPMERLPLVYEENSFKKKNTILNENFQIKNNYPSPYNPLIKGNLLLSDQFGCPKAINDNFSLHRGTSKSLLNNFADEDDILNKESATFNNIFNSSKGINFALNNSRKNSNIDIEEEEQLEIIKTNSVQELIPSRLDNEFKILKTLETGTFGVVYKCLSLSDNIIYAIKKSKKQARKSDIAIIKNLIIDLSLLAKFNNLSNFVVKYKEAWAEEGILLIKQEFCKYGDLLDFLETLEKNNFTFSLDFYWDIVFQMICGLKYLHESGYIHLDIKPTNFFVGEKGLLKLGDFNLTRKKNKFNDDYFEGDSTYMAPEIMEATRIKDLNDNCDIFSLGLSILEILFKIELPQNGVLWRQIRSQNFIIQNEFLNNSNLKEIPNEFFNLIYGMIHFDSKKRFNIEQIFQKFPELSLRLEKQFKNEYYFSYEEFLVKLDSVHDFSFRATSLNDDDF